MSYATVSSYGLSRYKASENDYQLKPKSGAEAAGRAVLFCHGAGGVAADPADTTKVGTFPLFQAIGRRYPLLSTDWGGPLTWGNAAEQAAVETGRVFAGTAMGSVVDKVHLIGISMGGQSVLQYARTNPTKVKSISLMIGAPDIDYIYQNDVGSSRAGIGTAWGVTYPTALPAGALLINDATSWDAIPVKAWYVTDDIFTPTASLTNLIASMALGSAVSLGALGHTEAAIAAIPVADVLAFLDANDA